MTSLENRDKSGDPWAEISVRTASTPVMGSGSLFEKDCSYSTLPSNKDEHNTGEASYLIFTPPDNNKIPASSKAGNHDISSGVAAPCSSDLMLPVKDETASNSTSERFDKTHGPTVRNYLPTTISGKDASKPAPSLSPSDDSYFLSANLTGTSRDETSSLAPLSSIFYTIPAKERENSDRGHPSTKVRGEKDAPVSPSLESAPCAEMKYDSSSDNGKMLSSLLVASITSTPYTTETPSASAVEDQVKSSFELWTGNEITVVSTKDQAVVSSIPSCKYPKAAFYPTTSSVSSAPSSTPAKEETSPISTSIPTPSLSSPSIAPSKLYPSIDLGFSSNLYIPSSVIPMWTANMLGNAYGGGYITTPSSFVTSFSDSPCSFGIPPGYELSSKSDNSQSFPHVPTRVSIGAGGVPTTVPGTYPMALHTEPMDKADKHSDYTANLILPIAVDPKDHAEIGGLTETEIPNPSGNGANADKLIFATSAPLSSPHNYSYVLPSDDNKSAGATQISSSPLDDSLEKSNFLKQTTSAVIDAYSMADQGYSTSFDIRSYSKVTPSTFFTSNNETDKRTAFLPLSSAGANFSPSGRVFPWANHSVILALSPTTLPDFQGVAFKQTARLTMGLGGVTILFFLF